MGVEEKRKFVINVMFYAILVAVAFFAVKYAYPLLSPFLLGLFVAFVLRRPIAFLSRKLHVRRGYIAVLITALMYATLGSLLVLLLVRLVVSLKDIFWELPGLYRSEVEPYLRAVTAWLNDTVLQLDPALNTAMNDIFTSLVDSLGSLVSSLSVRAVSVATNYLSALPGLVVRIVLTVIASFFFAVDYPRLVGFLRNSLPEPAMGVLDDIKQYLCGTLFKILRSYFMIMCITFAELSIGLCVIGVKRFLLIAALIAVLDIFPVLGSGGVLLPWAVISLAQGDVSRAIGLLVLYAIIFVVRQVIEPRIVGHQVGLHPIIMLVSMFVGVQMFGALGLFGLPILISLLRHLYLAEKLPWKPKQNSLQSVHE